MSLFTIDRTDNRLTDISRDRYDCFMFDMFTMREFNRIISGQSVILDRFILEHSESEEVNKRNKHILSKVRTIRNITRNNTNSNTYLVFQTISWKSTKNKMPYILIPVRIYDDGTKIVRNGEITINPKVVEDIDLGSYRVPKKYKDFQSLDSPELAKIIEGENGRVLYEMYLTHFKIEYVQVPHVVQSTFDRTLPVTHITPLEDSLFTLDKEAETIRDLVQEGQSVIVDTIKGTNRHPLIADFLFDALQKGKSVLFLSEAENTHLHQFLVDCGLNQYIEDDSDTKFHTKSTKVLEKSIEEVNLDFIDEVSLYQRVMRSETKGFPLNQLMRDYTLLSDFDDERVHVERLDELSNQDIQMIRRTLRQSEKIITKLKTTNPSDTHWNDLDLRLLRGVTKEFVAKLSESMKTMSELQEIRGELTHRFGLNLSNEIEKLYTDIQHNEHVRADLFPEQWFDESVFQQAKESMISAGNVVGRAYSLRHTLLISYKNQILTDDVIAPFEAVKTHRYFTLDLEETNRLLDYEQYMQDTMNRLYEYAKEWVRTAKDLEEFHEFSQNANFHQKVVDHNYVLTHPLMKKRWFQMDREKLIRVLEILEKQQDLLLQYMNLRKELKDLLLESISSVDEEIIVSYQNALESRSIFRFKPEFIYSEKIVNKHVTEEFKLLNKSLKSYLMERALLWKEVQKEAQPLLEEVQSALGVKLTINELDDLRKIVDILIRYEWESIHLMYTPDQINRLKRMDQSYQNIVKEVYDYLEESGLSYLFSTSLDTLRENYSAFKEYLERIYYAKKRFLGYFKNDVTSLSIQTMRSITHTCMLYHKSNQELMDHEEEFEHLYSIFYKGVHTDFKNIQERITLFEELKTMFLSVSDLQRAFQTGALGIIRGALQSLVIQLEQLSKQLDDIERFFVHGYPTDEFSALMEYMEQFMDVDAIDQWIMLMDDFQRLRNYFQLRLVALINTGLLKSHLVEHFERSLYHALIEQMDTIEDSAKHLDLEKAYDLIRTVEQRKISELTPTRYKSLIHMSSVYAFHLYENKDYDLMIIDGAEKIHQNVIKQLAHHMHQMVIIFDSSEPVQFDTIPRYLVKYPLFRLQNNYKLSLYAHESHHKGVVYEQQHFMMNPEDLLSFILDRIQTKNEYINVVCSLNAFRLELFDQINDAVYEISKDNDEYMKYIEHIHILIAGEFHPRSDVTIVFYEDEIDTHLNRILLNTGVLAVIDNQNEFKNSSVYQKLMSPQSNLYSDVEDPFLIHLLKELHLEGVQVKKAIMPYDFLVFREDETKVLVKIAYHEKENSDILEDTLMMYHPAYDDYEKVVVSIGDYYHKKEDTILKLRELILRGKRKQNKST